MRTLYVAKYVSRTHRTLNAEEITARRVAQCLKDGDEDAIHVAARAMAALIAGPCWLVPVPASDGSLRVNLVLSRAIAALVPDARVKCAVARARPVESSWRRRLQGLPGLTIDEHAIIRTVGPIDCLPAYLVDNIVTTGTTIAACRRALGWGQGLCYADASTAQNSRSLPRRA